ncbi:MAG TPA: glyceraldehyde 3-phosphate dehydrogenase NAD-binding domain-containing protein [Thermoanaerobaculia bacterium]|nr:glyceraldehyde 3-phosphate dehydrogenase NAD-binding domain-containing protein [Thermoanaerobaculia bacterium]
MEPIRIGLSGLGRIGRNLFRILAGREDIQLVAINDAANPNALAYLLRFDTIHGRFPEPVVHRDGHVEVGGRRIRLLAAPEPGGAPWGELGVDVVIEEGEPGRTRSELEKHFEVGARRVILCVPSAEPAELTFVRGINDHLLERRHRLISNGSCIAHAAAPILQILDTTFGIERVYLTTVHAYTDQQRLADVPAEDMRSGRAAAENIIPQHTNAPQLLAELMPHLAGRIAGTAMNVPVANGSVVDLVCWHSQPVTVEAVNAAVAAAAAEPRWQGFLLYETEPIVSSDVLRSSYSSNFDSLATMVLAGRVSKTLSWFDNGWGYAHRVVELIERFRDLDREAA